jgi:hypothetical protein
MTSQSVGRFIRSNVLGLTALFIALTGTALAGQQSSGGGPSARKSVATDAKFKQLKKRVAALEAKATYPPSGPAGGSLAGSYPAPSIAGDAIGPNQIANPTRSINLPLTSFVNRTDGTTLGFGPDDGTSPNLLIGGSGTGNRLAIAWDDDSDGAGPNIADIDFVMTTFTVPPDYASGDSYVLRISKDANTSGTSEEFFCQQATNNGLFNDPGGNAFDSATIATAAMQDYTFDVPITVPLSPGDTVNISCRADVSPGVTSADDEVRLHSIEFVYSATQ